MSQAPWGLALAPASQVYLLLERLRAYAGRPVSIGVLMHVTGSESVSAVRQLVSQLRAVLGDEAQHLQTVGGIAYRWDGPGISRANRYAEHDVILDFRTCRIFTEGRIITLTVPQMWILEALTVQPERVVDIPTLQAVTGFTSLRGVLSAAIALQRLLEPLRDSRIRSVRGLGFQYLGPPLRHAAGHASGSAK